MLSGPRSTYFSAGVPFHTIQILGQTILPERHLKSNP